MLLSCWPWTHTGTTDTASISAVSARRSCGSLVRMRTFWPSSLVVTATIASTVSARPARPSNSPRGSAEPWGNRVRNNALQHAEHTSIAGTAPQCLGQSDGTDMDRCAKTLSKHQFSPDPCGAAALNSAGRHWFGSAGPACRPGANLPPTGSARR